MEKKFQLTLMRKVKLWNSMMMVILGIYVHTQAEIDAYYDKGEKLKNNISQLKGYTLCESSFSTNLWRKAHIKSFPKIRIRKYKDVG